MIVSSTDDSVQMVRSEVIEVDSDSSTCLVDVTAYMMVLADLLMGGIMKISHRS